MKKIITAAILVFVIASPVLAKSRSRAHGAAHRANRVGKGNKSCGSCDTNYANCMKTATANPQMQTMCAQAKEQCRASGCK